MRIDGSITPIVRNGSVAHPRAARSAGSPLLLVLVLCGCKDPPRPEHTTPPANTTVSAAALSNASTVPSAAATNAAVSNTPTAEPSARPARTCENLIEAPDNARIPPGPAGFSVRGVDASTLVPWKRVQAEGFSFAILQASFGPRKNPSFESNWSMARTCGLRRAAYHFLAPASDGQSQARTFLDTLGDDPGELLPIVDVERSPGCKSACCELSCSDWSDLTAAWLKEVEARLGVKPLVYTVEDFWKECLCNKSRFAKRELWLAGYPRFDAAPRPGFGGWLKWAFYQHKGNVRIGKGVVDLNVFRGTTQELDAYSIRPKE